MVNAMMMTALTTGHSGAEIPHHALGPATDYDTVRAALEFIYANWREQPPLERVAEHVALSPFHLQRVFTRWAGLSARRPSCRRSPSIMPEPCCAPRPPLLDTTYETGLSGPGRLHDLFVTHDAMSPGIYKARGEGLTIRYGLHLCPFGTAAGDGDRPGLAGLAFADPGRDAGKPRRHDGPLAEGDLCRRSGGDGALCRAHFRSPSLGAG